MKNQTLSSNIFSLNFLVSGVLIIALLAVLSTHFLPNHNALHLGVITVGDIFIRISMIYWIVGPSLLALFANSIIDKRFHSTSSSIASLIASIISTGYALYSHLDLFFINSSGLNPGDDDDAVVLMLFLFVIPVIQFGVYLLVLAIIWILAGIITWTTDDGSGFTGIS